MIGVGIREAGTGSKPELPGNVLYDSRPAGLIKVGSASRPIYKGPGVGPLPFYFPYRLASMPRGP